MRKAVTLIQYLAMIAIGSWASYERLVLGGRGIAFKFGAFLAVFGAYLLWADFLSPSRERSSRRAGAAANRQGHRSRLKNGVGALQEAPVEFIVENAGGRVWVWDQTRATDSFRAAFR